MGSVKVRIDQRRKGRNSCRTLLLFPPLRGCPICCEVTHSRRGLQIFRRSAAGRGRVTIFGLDYPAPSNEAAPARWRTLALLAIAELLGMSLWFSGSAVVPALTKVWNLSAGTASWL